jgi:thiamine kinase-like enzyme
VAGEVALVGEPAEADALDVIARCPSLAATPRVVTGLPGGLTNRNYRVTTPDGAFVARLWAAAADGDLLAINRDHEYRNSVIAARAGVGAPVIEYRPADRVMVLGFLDGATYANADVQAAASIPRIAAVLRRLHAAPRFAGDFDMFEVQARYRAAARRAGVAVPRGYDDLAPAFAAARAALAVRPEPAVPCHNDLLAANFIDDGTRLHLIDYEYAGNNDPCFELGNIAGECGLPPETLAALVSAYYGRARPGAVARARLFTLVAQYGWTLWGVLQHARSPLAFDFWSWAMERFEAAAAGLTRAGLGQLLDDVAKGDP